MGRRADDTRVLSEARLCEIVGITRQRRTQWAARGLLRKAPRKGKYGAIDAAELSAFSTLVSTLGYDDAVLAWRSIRCAHLEVLMAADRKIVVFDHQRKTAVLVDSDAAIGPHVVHGRLSRVIDLTLYVAGVQDTFRRLLEEHRRRERDRRQRLRRTRNTLAS